MAQQALVLHCVQYDGTTCTQEAWLPAPSLLPPDLTAAEVGALLTATAVCFAVAWAAKKLRRSITN